MDCYFCPYRRISVSSCYSCLVPITKIVKLNIKQTFSNLGTENDEDVKTLNMVNLSHRVFDVLNSLKYPVMKDITRGTIFGKILTRILQNLANI